MQDWLESLSLVQQLVIGIPAAGLACVWIWRGVQRLRLFVARVNAGLVKLDQFDPKAFNTCVETVKKMSDNLGPNGGRSFYDKLNANGQATRRTEARLSTLIDVVVDRHIFMTDTAGEFTWVNAAFERTFETSCDDVAGRGWINLLMPEDRDRVVREWRHAVQDRRAFHTMTRCLTQRTAATFPCKCSAEPILDEPTGDVIGWLGTLAPPEGDPRR